jgi:hypothetical protein
MDIIIHPDLPNMSKSKDINKLGEIYPFEFQVLEAFFGEYMKNAYKKNLIIVAYMKVRQADFMVKICFHPEKRQHFWNLLCILEEDMHLPFRAIDGRDGRTFAQMLPAFAPEPTAKIMESVNKEMESVEQHIVMANPI